MSDLFDLEQQIMDCWRIVDDIKVLEEAVLDKEQSHDDTGNVLIGFEYLYQLKFEKLFATFEKNCEKYHQYRKFYEMNQAPEIDILDSQIAKGGKEMTKDEALKLALEALEFVNRTGDTQVFDMFYADKAITAIKEALASSVATNDTSKERVDETAKHRHEQERQWQGLTDEEMEQCYESLRSPINDWALGQAIEAKLKEKNK